jgi:hypothetical protein
MASPGKRDVGDSSRDRHGMARAALADRRCSAPKPEARRRETARLDHRKENGELIAARHSRSRHFKLLEQYLQHFMAISERG